MKNNRYLLLTKFNIYIVNAFRECEHKQKHQQFIVNPNNQNGVVNVM